MVASSGSGSREEGGGLRKGVKKGPWTTAEDAMLVEYVRKNGEGNWNAVQRNCGLLRCGKSCRLRWANHLRPNLKKGSFSADEERLIIELHAQLGNKWARMASQLPGRTDNEIKNYWNTRVKRHQRAGLPIYPDDIQQQQQYDRYPQLHQHRNYQKSKFNPSHPLLDPITNFPTIPNPSQPPCPSSSFLSNPSQQFAFFRNIERSGRNFSLPQSSSFSPSTLFNQSLIKTDFLPPYQNPVFQFRPDDFEINPFAIYPPCNETELSSIQSPAVAMPTPATSGTTCGGDYTVIGTTGDAPDEAAANSGLLDALLEESNALVQSENLRNEVSFGAHSSFQPDGLTDEDAGNFFNDSSSANSSVGMKEKEPLLIEEMDHSEDDFSSLFNSFPLTDPVPPWYDASADSSNGKPSNMKEYGDSAMDNSPDGSHTPGKTAPATASPDWSLGSGCWNNMPGIC
ncbi:hypothetical protein RHSIM_Rhsim06G0163100 [Rhododendron simsii]|uniref:Uncharacterized protein n=1 Tax=Rhododendron simsii TaxID=118357 RepID=A0A834GSK9_RHOSS|nr:hypothetical protein RHSIM_Rhsim06G0163100 [Rhododendron simsii]